MRILVIEDDDAVRAAIRRADDGERRVVGGEDVHPKRPLLDEPRTVVFRPAGQPCLEERVAVGAELVALGAEELVH